MTIAFVFPGQGSQQVGMGAELARTFTVAREAFQEVDDALSQSLSRLMWEGPEDELTLTENAQPAIMAVSLAVVRTLQKEGNFDLGARVSYVAGHSLGEYSALASAGAFSLADTARLLKIRGRAMQRAVPVGEGAMAALLGLELDDVRDVAANSARGEVCEAANDNAPGQVVVSGHKAAVERALELAQERGARRAVMLAVSAPFHCALMRPAADAMAEALEEVPPAVPVVPLVANVSAEAVTGVDAVRRGLVDQVTGMVRWRESVQYMAEHDTGRYFEIGAGKVLCGLVRRIDRELEATPVGAPAEIEAALERL